MSTFLRALALLFLIATLAVPAGAKRTDPLPSWNDGAAKTAIVGFVAAVTARGGSRYVLPAERIAVFDNDGTLWAEQPIYVQFAFTFDRVRTLASEHPEWRHEQPFRAVLDGDLGSVVAGGEQALAPLMAATHAGMTTDEFAATVLQWIETAKHPQTGRRYLDMTYQPMLELLEYLRANGFKTYIVSGGGVEFIRPWVERVYGVPPEQVIGSSIVTSLEMRGGAPVLVRKPELNFLDDKAGKPVAINQHIGRRPIAAFGNSDGDLQMLQWTTAGSGARFALIVRHTDATREWAYDRHSSIGRLDHALDEARSKGWTIVEMARDWRVIFP